MTRKIVFATLLLLAVVASFPSDATAIPAWSRKESVSCNYCHYRFNRLNQTGLDYYRRGFRNEAVASHSETEVKREIGNFLSALGRVDVTKREDHDYTTRVQATLYAGGELSPNWSFLSEVTIGTQDLQEVADTYVAYTAGQKDKYVFVRAGQLLPFITVDNPWEVAADRDASFARDRRVGTAVGYNYNKFWAEAAVLTPAGATTRDKFDFVGNGQYVFTDKGTSLGGIYWEGNYNTLEDVTFKYRRYGVTGNFNELAKGKLLLAAGWTGGRGDSAEGGDNEINSYFGQAEYVFSDKFSMLGHVVRANYDTDVADDSRTIFTASAFYWPVENINIIGRFILIDPPSGSTDKRYTISARFMY